VPISTGSSPGAWAVLGDDVHAVKMPVLTGSLPTEHSEVYSVPVDLVGNGVSV
jgi:hypothetical protein